MSEIDDRICGEEGCSNNWRSPGGLQNVGSAVDPLWRCFEHRKKVDYSSHRNDLRAAINRNAQLAVRRELEKILAMTVIGTPELAVAVIANYVEAALKAPVTQTPEDRPND